MANALFLPTEIPWSKLTGPRLEELLYWLFDSMGARDLEWRIGGEGGGSADQGRDLELNFYLASSVGNLELQRWWVEAKGRAGTISPTDVKEAIINSAAKKDVDVFLIATNSMFSNPTRNWVSEYQKNHSRPKIKLWERTDLENLCSKNPLAVVRMFSKALSSQGKLEVVREKLWTYATFASAPMLEDLWNQREQLEIDQMALLALVSSEFANGSIEERSWAKIVERDVSLDALANGLLNLGFWVIRSDEMGAPQEPLVRGLAYLILVSITNYSDQEVTRLLYTVWGAHPAQPIGFEVKNMLLGPVLQTLNDELHDVCTSDCLRVSTERVDLSEGQVDNYWHRLSTETGATKKNRRERLIIESYKTPCKVGFRLGKKKRCPIVHTGDLTRDIGGFLKTIRIIAEARASEIRPQ